jgi:pimeloyl-ACP methyl ester carboxylesterase
MTRSRRYGAVDGAPVIYLHGAPGAPEEAAVFDGDAGAAGVSLICPDRFSLAPSLDGSAYVTALAQAILDLSGGRPFDLIGFSLGGFRALQVAAELGPQVRRLHLVSAAAPLECGAFLEAMAGRPVFEAARRSPRLFAALSLWQGWLARAAPGAMFRLLFGSAAGGDRILAADPDFQAELSAILRSSLTKGRRGYMRDVNAYVRPWAERLPRVAAPCFIWHGVEDNWSPPAMASALAERLAPVAQVEMLPGLSHYSALRTAMPLILARAGQTQP